MPKISSAGKKAGSPSKKPLTVPQSPFSTNREYSIPRGEGFSPKKSTKSPTKFEDFEHLDRAWKVNRSVSYGIHITMFSCLEKCIVMYNYIFVTNLPQHVTFSLCYKE